MAPINPRTLNSHQFNSQDSSPNSNQKPSEDNSEDQLEDLYLECLNQEHYFEKYHEKTGQWPSGMGIASDPLIVDKGSGTEDSETEVSAMGITVREPEVVGHLSHNS